MNERIRELHKQVMRWNDTPDCSYNAEFCVPEEYTQKLAELIVRQCIGIVADAVDHREPASTYVGKIKTDFGIEE